MRESLFDEAPFDEAPFVHRLANATKMQQKYRGYSTCFRCHQPWYAGVTPKILSIPNNGGMFAICKACWNELDTEQRIPYHIALYWEWGGRDWPVSLIEEAIRNEQLGEAPNGVEMQG